jgi:flagellar hook-associated protein 2
MSSVTSSTSSTSTASTSTVSNGRYWGLASGLDVDSIVTGLVADQQSKIDKADQAQQTLEWQQEAYRSITTELNTFESAYLQLGTSTSMASSNMYTSYTTTPTTTSGDSVLTAIANSDATGVAQTVDITQSAASASLTGTSASGNSILSTSNSWTAALTALKATSADQSFSMTVDDVTKTITLSSSEIAGLASGDTAALKTLIDGKLSTAFGTVDGTTAKVSTNDSTSDNFGFTSAAAAAKGFNVKVSVSSPSSGGDALSSLGITSGTNNRLNTDTALSELGLTASDGSYYTTINGTTITLGTSTSTISDALKAINSSGAGVTATYDSSSDKISLTANQSGSTGSVTITSDTSNFLEKLGVTTATASSIAGQDAIFSITSGGTTTNYTRASNNFTISGVTYSINSPVSSSEHSVASLTFSQDTSALKTGLQNFISAYNTLITDIHTQINTAPDSDYPPLTDAQKTAMTTTQIDEWNAKADSGMLYNDNTLQSICESMRSVLDQSVTTSDGSKISLYDIGITTSDTSTDYGKLEIKATDESKFATAIASNASKIAELFTKSSSTMLTLNPTSTQVTAQKARTTNEGLVNRLDDIIKGATGDVLGTYGSLVKIAGTTSMNTYENSIYKQITDGNTNITNLKTQLTNKENKLYTEFENLETYMSEADSQSSVISSLSGS